MNGDNNKPWRVTGDEFDELSKELIKNDVSYIRNNIATIIKSESARSNAEKLIKKFYKSFDSEGGFDFKIGLSIALLDINRWAEVSIRSKDINDIILRELIGIKYKCTLVCNAYLSGNSVLTEDMVEDLMYINSGMFKFDNWDDTHVSAVVNAIDNMHIIPPKQNEEMLKLYDISEIKSELKDKLDWNAISINSNMSKEFLEKHSHLVGISRNYYRPDIKIDDDSDDL